MEFVAGVTRWRRRLDFVLSAYYRGKYDSMEPTLRQILRIGLYDIVFLRTPSYAAVSEAVELAKKRLRRGAGSLVNGVLRSIVRAQDDLPAPHTGDTAEDLAILHSHPTWMVRRWLDRYGEERTEALLRWNNTRPVYGVRVNAEKTSLHAFTAKLDELGIEWESGRFLSDFVRIRALQPLLASGLVREGTCSIQDESAGLLVQLLDPQPGETVVDVCAAPGSKSLYAAQRMKNEGRVLSVDVHEGRLRLVDRAARQQGSVIVETLLADARTLRPDDVLADRLLLDAPCSGLGVLAKRADLRWKRTPDDVKDLVRLQDEILEVSSRLVRPGGVLVYGTCTIEPEENERRVEAFLERHAEYHLESAAGIVRDGLATPSGYYATFPPRDGVDGAFGARLRRAAKESVPAGNPEARHI